MPITQRMYDFSNKPLLRRLIPKRVQTRIYRGFIKHLTEKYIAETRPERIYATRPFDCDRGSPLKLWMLTSGPDLLMCVWCLKSLMYYSNEKWDVWIADGGNLDADKSQCLKSHFPGIRILSRTSLDEKSRPLLKDYPYCHWLRHVRPYAPSMKLFDPLFHLAPQRFLLLDSDILFFRDPRELLTQLRAAPTQPFLNYFNMENGQVNSGLAIIESASLQLPEIEAAMESMTEKQRRYWTIEQDLYTTLSQGRTVGLPGEYAVQPLNEEQHALVTSCHYIGVCRHRFFSQGVARLCQSGFLDAIR